MNIFKTVKNVVSYAVDSTSTVIAQSANMINGDLVEVVWLSAEFSRRHPTMTKLTLKYYTTLAEIFEGGKEACELQATTMSNMLECNSRDDVKVMLGQ